MAIQIQKKVKLENQFRMVKLQLLLHVFFNNLEVSDAELSCATYLALRGYRKDFYRDVVDYGIFKSSQTARNCMSKLRKTGLAIKQGKEWVINPRISLGIDNVILLELKAMN